MAPVLLLAALGTGLLLASQKAKAAPSPYQPAPSSAQLEAELIRLRAHDPTLHAAIARSLTTPTPPDEISRYRTAVSFPFPAIAQALGQRMEATTYVQNVLLKNYEGIITYWLDPQGLLHAYDNNMTPVVVIAPRKTPEGRDRIASRNPSSSFDWMVDMIAGMDMRPVFEVLQARAK